MRNYIALTIAYFVAGVLIAQLADLPMVLTGLGLVGFLWAGLLTAYFSARELLDPDDDRGDEFFTLMWGTPLAMIIGVIAVRIAMWITGW